MPGIVYMLARYYRRKELTVRIGFFMLLAAGGAQGARAISASVVVGTDHCTAFGGLLASGLLSLAPIHAGARWVRFASHAPVLRCLSLCSATFSVRQAWIFSSRHRP